MAVTTTPLGFQKPDGNEPVRNGDNVIAANAQKAEDLLSDSRLRLNVVESTANTAAAGIASNTSRLTSVEAMNAGQNVRIGSIESAAFVGGGLLMEDPADPGFYIVGG